MKTIKIEKFIVNRNYSSKSTNKVLLFHLQERNNNELTFSVIHTSDLKTTASGIAKFESYKDGAREIVRVGGADGYFDIVATDIMPIGRKLSELSPERREIIENVIKQDVERRKRRNLNRASVTTLYKIDPNRKIHYSGHVESNPED